MLCPLNGATSAMVTSLLSFLSRHINAIPHDVLALVSDHQTSLEAQAIASTLQTVPRTLISLDFSLLNATSKLQRLINDSNVLFVSLLPQSEFASRAGQLRLFTKPKQRDKFVFFVTDVTNFFQLPLSRVYDNSVCILLQPNVEMSFRVNRLQSEETFSRSDSPDGDTVLIHGEDAFIGSIHWTLFRGRLTKLPGDLRVELIASAPTTTSRHPVLYKQRVYVTGIDVGLSMIWSQAVGLHRLHQRFLENTTQDVKWKTRYLDWRQSVELDNSVANKNVSIPYHVAIGLNASDFWNPGGMLRYVVMAPRQAVDVSIATILSSLGDRFDVLLTLFGTTAAFVAIRGYFQWILNEPGVRLSVGQMFVDTFGRMVSNSSGCWIGRWTAERQLLLIISGMGFVINSLFGSVLYSQLMNVARKERYNTIEDLCANGVEIKIPAAVRLHRDVPKHCARGKSFGRFLPSRAYIQEEGLARILVGLGHHHIFAKTYATLPVPLSFSHSFLEHPVQRILVRCTEHGFRAALKAQTMHSMAIAVEQETPKRQETAGKVDLYFEFGLLALGLGAAGVAFVVELWMGGRIHD